MIGVVTLISMPSVTQFVAWIFISTKDSKHNLNLLYAVMSVGIYAYSVGFWLLCFKYWQTAFELDFLFMMWNEQRSIKHKKLFVAMNSFMIGMGFIALLIVLIGLA